MRPRVLVVDDENAILLTLRAILERNGFQVETATSSIEGTKKIMAMVFHLVVTDMRMEHPAAGYQVIEAAQRVAYKPLTVLLTAYPPEESEWRAKGVSALFEKPVNVAALLRELCSLMRQRAGATA